MAEGRLRRVNRAIIKLSSRFINPAVAVGAFLTTCGLFHHLLPPQEIEVVTPKLQFFQSHQDEFDTLFVGSSRFYHQISPAIFDDVTRKRGVPTHSFNFGIDGMHLPESFYVLDLILARKPKRLKWVFIEFDALQVTPWPEYRGTQRLLYWHDWTRTALVVRKLLSLDVWENPKHELQRAWGYREYLGIHLALFAKNFCNVGNASVLIRRGFSREPEITTAANVLGPHRDGFFASDVKMASTEKTAYEQALARARQAAKPRGIDRYGDEAFRICARKVRECGAIPIFICPPAVATRPVGFFRSTPPGAVWAFNDYEAFAALFRTEVRANQAHLNKTGAAEFTRLLAERFASELSTNAIR
ncbi:MAG: hypothetical protein ABJB22_07880 [Verrucomicrobiota bacterium]